MGYATSMGGLGGIFGPLLVGWLYGYDITLPYYVSAGIFVFLLVFAVYTLRGKKAESM
jgi:MFS family permease